MLTGMVRVAETTTVVQQGNLGEVDGSSTSFEGRANRISCSLTVHSEMSEGGLALASRLVE